MDDRDAKYDEVVRSIAINVAQDLLNSTNDMQHHVLLEVIEALNRGEDVYDKLVNVVLARPFMERFIDELLKYEEE